MAPRLVSRTCAVGANRPGVLPLARNRDPGGGFEARPRHAFVLLVALLPVVGPAVPVQAFSARASSHSPPCRRGAITRPITVAGGVRSIVTLRGFAPDETGTFRIDPGDPAVATAAAAAEVARVHRLDETIDSLQLRLGFRTDSLPVCAAGVRRLTDGAAARRSRHRSAGRPELCRPTGRTGRRRGASRGRTHPRSAAIRWRSTSAQCRLGQRCDPRHRHPVPQARARPQREPKGDRLRG